MKTYRKELWLNVPSRVGFVNTTPRVEECLRESGIRGENADAHLMRSVMGREVVVAITGGKLDFGPWEQIFHGEFDGRRKKRVLVKVVGEKVRRRVRLGAGTEIPLTDDLDEAL